jgi:hypothetical protein
MNRAIEPARPTPVALRRSTTMAGGGWKTGGDGESGPVARAQGWLERVPGYRGYRDKEDRRDADRRVRDRIAADLDARAERAEAVARALANQRRLAEIGPVDELARSIRHLIDRVRTASYGYGGLFSDRSIDERALDQLRLFDESLLAGVASVDESLSALEAAQTEGSDLAGPAATAASRVKVLHDRLDLRGQVIESGQAAPQASVDAVLAGDQPSAPPPAFDLAYRDAISILGDNFIVDARIDVAAGDDSLRLFRVKSSEPERWLLVPRRTGQELALLDKASGAAPADPTTINGSGFTGSNSGRGDGELSTAERASGRRPVAFEVLRGTGESMQRALVLDWEGERQLFVGSVVDPADVEIFGSGAT